MNVSQLLPEGAYHILVTSHIPRSTLVLKQDDVFGVFDSFGDVDRDGVQAGGIYYKGTRFLSSCRLRFAGTRPLLLSSTVRRDNVVLAVDLTNPDLHGDQGILLPHGSLHIYRSQFIWDNTLYQRIRMNNFSQSAIRVRMTLEFDADFVDIFEVRGTPRLRHGSIAPPRMHRDALVLAYEGLDRVFRRTVIRCSKDDAALTPEGVRFDEVVAPCSERTIEVTITFECDHDEIESSNYDTRLASATADYTRDSQECKIWTSNEQFDLWLDRSRNDLRMLSTKNSDGVYPYAGVPWFATPFGRDGILSALEMLWVDPTIARGVLGFLTKTQAREYAPEQDAEPGKIIHEARDGEMAALDEIPFRRYYGSVDATPLYLMLAGAYLKRTGDIQFIEQIWEGLERASRWLDGDGDPDRDGFVEYSRKADGGLTQQGWKDSADAIYHSDGSIAEPPVALCEVQAYAYRAKIELARICEIAGREADARRLSQEAERLQAHFEQAFWSPELGTYVIALDGQKRPCQIRSSNAGHALYCGISSAHRAQIVAQGFLGERFHSGWGIRTVAVDEPRYNPMAYHNGSIWPHDNAVISAGFSRYGFTHLSARVMAGLFEAAASLAFYRLPELFCGFPRRPGKTPTLYPTACSPQAWSAGAAFLLLKSSIGLSINALERRVILNHPVLPDFLDQVYVQNLTASDARLDLRLFRSGAGVAVSVERRVGNIDVVILY